MKVRIVLPDGVIIEADGTALEIANLTDALRGSHQVARPEKEETSTEEPPQPVPGPDDRPEVVDPDDLDIPERREEDDDAALDAGESSEEEGGVLSTVVEIRPERADFPRPERSEASGPPLELVIREVAVQFRLLADPTRLRVLTLLAERGHNVGELCEALGGQSQPAVSHHLALLRVSGLVVPSRDGKFQYYDLTDQGRTLTSAVGHFGPDGTDATPLFRQASDPTRLQILAILSEGDRNVGELCVELGGMSQPAVSHHLALLRHGGLVEARRTGKFSYYSLLERGHGLTGLVAPMLAAKARVVPDPAADMFEAEASQFSSGPDDWTDDISLLTGEAGGVEARDGGAPPGHLLCRRVLLMVHDLHRRGYERLRIAPALSRSGLHWHCSVLPAGGIRPHRGAMPTEESGAVALYDSGQGACFFGWDDAEHDSPAALAIKFLERFPDVAALGRGEEQGYARWYARMLRATDPDGLIYAEAGWELPADHLPALGCTADVKIPLPPGDSSSGDE